MKKYIFFSIALLALAGCGRTHNALSATEASIHDTTLAAAKPAPPAAKDTLPPPGSEFIDEDNMNRIYITRQDSSMTLTANIRADHRIFGYQQPDTSSARLFLLSVFTNDVQGNPFHCPLGAYYETNNDSMTLKYLGNTGKYFVQAQIIKPGQPADTIYMLRKWTQFDE